MKQNQAQQDRVDRAIKEVQEKHDTQFVRHGREDIPSIVEAWVEYEFYGSELHLYVWSKSQQRTIAHYTDVVDDLEHALTAPQNARQR